MLMSSPAGFQLRLLLALLLVWSLAGSGCATIATGTTETIKIKSDPSGAHVKVIPSGKTATTPAKLDLSKSNSYVIRITKECFEEERVEIENPMHPMFFANILLGGVIGMIVDVSSGGGFDLEPEQADVKLKPMPECGVDAPSEEAEPEAEANAESPMEEPTDEPN